MTAVSIDLAGYPARYFAAWSRRDLGAALDVVGENVRWQDPSLPEAITDRDGAAAFFTAAWSGFPDLKMLAIGEPLVDVANRSCVRCHRYRRMAGRRRRPSGVGERLLECHDTAGATRPGLNCPCTPS